VSPIVQVRTRSWLDNLIATLRLRYLRARLRDNDRYLHQLERAVVAHRRESQRLRCELAHWER
jgi:hypothetical protein